MVDSWATVPTLDRSRMRSEESESTTLAITITTGMLNPGSDIQYMLSPTSAITQLRQQYRGSRRQERSHVVVNALHRCARSRLSPFESAIVVLPKRLEKLNLSLIHTKALQVSFHYENSSFA